MPQAPVQRRQHQHQRERNPRSDVDAFSAQGRLHASIFCRRDQLRPASISTAASSLIAAVPRCAPRAGTLPHPSRAASSVAENRDCPDGSATRRHKIQIIRLRRMHRRLQRLQPRIADRSRRQPRVLDTCCTPSRPADRTDKSFPDTARPAAPRRSPTDPSSAACSSSSRFYKDARHQRPLRIDRRFLLHQRRQGHGLVIAGGQSDPLRRLPKALHHRRHHLLRVGVPRKSIRVREQITFKARRRRIQIADQPCILPRCRDKRRPSIPVPPPPPSPQCRTGSILPESSTPSYRHHPAGSDSTPGSSALDDRTGTPRPSASRPSPRATPERRIHSG